MYDEEEDVPRFDPDYEEERGDYLYHVWRNEQLSMEADNGKIDQATH